MNKLKKIIIACLPLALLICAPNSANAIGQAGLFLNPATGSFLVGSTFDISIILDTKGVAVNTIEIELLFPPDKLQVATPSVGQSIIQLWPAPPLFSNREGRIYFVGGIPSPGITTSQGIVLTLTFRVVAPGSGEIKFGEKTSVLANDGRGTDILGQTPSAFFKFFVPPPLGPTITSPTHPDQERWYKDTNPVFMWPKGPFGNAYSYAIDHDSMGFPDTQSEGGDSTASYENLESGIWYFHLRERADSKWGGVSHFIVKIDNNPPAAFNVDVSPGLRTASNHPFFTFFTTDSLSGLDHFEMKIIPLSQKTISEALFFEITSPYQAPRLDPGRYQVVIRALDKAGNSQDETIKVTIVGFSNMFSDPEGIDLILFFISWTTLIDTGVILIIILALVLLGLWRNHRHHLKHAFREDIENLFKFKFFRKKPPQSSGGIAASQPLGPPPPPPPPPPISIPSSSSPPQTEGYGNFQPPQGLQSSAEVFQIPEGFQSSEEMMNHAEGFEPSILAAIPPPPEETTLPISPVPQDEITPSSQA